MSCCTRLSQQAVSSCCGGQPSHLCIPAPVIRPSRQACSIGFALATEGSTAGGNSHTVAVRLKEALCSSCLYHVTGVAFCRGIIQKFQLAAIDHMQPSLVKRVQAAALSWVSSSDSALKLVTFWERAGGTRPHAELRQCPPATEFDTHHAQEGKLAPATSKIHQAAWPAGSCSRQPGRLYSSSCLWLCSRRLPQCPCCRPPHRLHLGSCLSCS